MIRPIQTPDWLPHLWAGRSQMLRKAMRWRAFILQKSTATNPTPADNDDRQLHRTEAPRQQTPTVPRVCKQEVRGSIPRVSTQVRGPFRMTGRA